MNGIQIGVGIAVTITVMVTDVETRHALSLQITACLVSTKTINSSQHQQ